MWIRYKPEAVAIGLKNLSGWVWLSGEILESKK
jgi:hypothetical protein